MLYQRIITALVLLPFVAILFYWLPLEIFASVVSVIIYLLGVEWGRLAGLTSLLSSLYGLFLSGMTLLLRVVSDELVVWPSVAWPNALRPDWPLMLLLAASLVSLLSVFIVLSFRAEKNVWSQNFVKLILGALLLPGFYVALIAIRRTEYLGDVWYGAHLLLFMFVLIWAADTGAFVAGKLFGQHKLAPNISPNKTIEGAIGGVLLSMTAGAIGMLVLNLPVNNLPLYFGGIFVLSVLSVFGDLFESVLKREAGVKDSGTLLPGHGGVLDRLDSSLVVAPVFFTLFSVMEWL